VNWIRRAKGNPSRLGILPGTFNPVTVAHVALGRAALAQVDEVLFVIPRVFPHKSYAGATLEERAAMLEAALAADAACSIGISDRGLFAEIAGECRAAYGEHVRLSFLCGRDAAERIVGWDYGRPGAIGEMLRGFDLLVAARAGAYQPEAEVAAAVRRLELPAGFDDVSATEVRRRIARGDAWEHLVPAAIVERARRVYS
jgi:nicotinate-nucleotide adenylyltransferase